MQLSALVTQRLTTTQSEGTETDVEQIIFPQNLVTCIVEHFCPQILNHT